MIVAVDVETYDPQLLTKGDGSLRCHDNPDGDLSFLMCVSTWDGEKGKSYIPGGEGWFEEFVPMMKDPNIEKVFHNSTYDLSWIQLGARVDVKGNCHDTMTRAAYIDEYQDLTLDACCKKMGVVGKNKDQTIEKWYKENLEEVKRLVHLHSIRGFRKTDPLWKHSDTLWHYSSEFQRNMLEYNIQDAKATWDLYQAQEASMAPMLEPYMVDVQLTPLVMEMKKQGILIDREKLGELADTVREDLNSCMYKLEEMYGIDSTILASPKKLGERLNQMGIHSPVKTDTGSESWAQGALIRIQHPVIPIILEARGYAKLLNTYLEGSLKEMIYHDNRIHCTFTPNKRDDGGTVTGRFSCSKPNLQQIPARDKAVGHSYGQAMRSLFLPEEGCMISALDYSQIEYLLLAHFAVGPQAEWLREQARSGVDFHTAAMDMTGIESRSVVKTFNYGVMYGMGWQTAMINNWVLFERLAKEQGVSIEAYTQEVYNNYHKKLPVIRETSAYVQELSSKQGYVTTLGGRRLHKQKAFWDPKTQSWKDSLYKMLNKLIQGTAADILKFSLLEAYKAGIFNTLTMHLTVHDENVVSVPYNKEGAEANAELKHIMESAFKDKLKVSMKCECELGPNWGYWDKDIWEEMKNGKFERSKECWWGAGKGA